MVYPPLGLWYLWSLLEARGHEVEFFDLSEDQLPLDGFDTYLVSGTSPQAYELRKIGATLRDHGRRAILGGSHVTIRGRTGRIDGFDVSVCGEINTTEQLDMILGAPPGSHLVFDNRPTLENIPLPCRKAAWRYEARVEDEHGVGHPTTTMFTSRGCPMRCGFCATLPLWGRAVRWIPFEDVRAEIEEIADLGFTGIMFYDDIFPLNKPRTLKMLDVLRHFHRSQGMIWRCFIRVDVIIKQGGRDYLKQMFDSGLREVLVGVETGSNTIKRNMDKGNTVEEDARVLQWCKEIGIRYKASFILGLPGETLETMEETRRWILENRPHRLDLNTFIPFPGTPIVDSVIKGEKRFDVYWDPDLVTEEFWYKGAGEQRALASIVGTSALTPQQIFEFHQKLAAEVASIPY